MELRKSLSMLRMRNCSCLHKTCASKNSIVIRKISSSSVYSRRPLRLVCFLCSSALTVDWSSYYLVLQFKSPKISYNIELIIINTVVCVIKYITVSEGGHRRQVEYSGMSSIRPHTRCIESRNPLRYVNILIQFGAVPEFCRFNFSRSFHLTVCELSFNVFALWVLRTTLV